MDFQKEKELVGVHLHMPSVEYHGLAGASSSALKAHYEGPTAAHARIKIEEPWEPCWEAVFGTMVHHWLLEPTSVPPCVSVLPEKYQDADGKMVDWNGRTTYCKTWVKNEKAKGRGILTREEWANVPKACDAILRHPVAGPLFRSGRPEVSVITWDEANGIPVRIRPDWKPERSMADVKLTGLGVGEREFRKLAYNRGFHIQAALYLDVWNAVTGEDCKEFRFIACENKPPFDVNVYLCPPEFIQRGREDVARYLAIHAACLRSGVWPGSPPDEKVLELPDWVN